MAEGTPGKTVQTRRFRAPTDQAALRQVADFVEEYGADIDTMTVARRKDDNEEAGTDVVLYYTR